MFFISQIAKVALFELSGHKVYSRPDKHLLNHHTTNILMLGLTGGAAASVSWQNLELPGDNDRKLKVACVFQAGPLPHHHSASSPH